MEKKAVFKKFLYGMLSTRHYFYKNYNPVLEVAETKGFDKVQFITFMLTYGDHMSNDVMGDEEDSMKTRLGLPAECTDGLASHPAVQGLFVDNMKIVMKQF